MITALLVQYNLGWTERVNKDAIQEEGGYRSEALLTLGAISNLYGANDIADGQLQAYLEPQQQVSLRVEPTGSGDVPTIDFKVGDTISVPNVAGDAADQRVVAIGMQEDEDGRVAWSPTVHGVVATAQDRALLAVKAMSNGTIGGTSKVASPLDILPGGVVLITNTYISQASEGGGGG